MDNKPTRPPIGLMPMKLHRELRLWDIYAAIRRYQDAGMEIPKQWIGEMETIEGWLQVKAGPEDRAEEFTDHKLRHVGILLSDDYKIGFKEGVQKFIEDNV